MNHLGILFITRGRGGRHVYNMQDVTFYIVYLLQDLDFQLKGYAKQVNSRDDSYVLN